MSETLIDVPVVDLYKEHENHNDEWLNNCSLCYEDKINTLAKYRKMIGYMVKKDDEELLEIMESQVEHPEHY